MDQWVSPGGCGWKMPWMITSTTLSTSCCRRNRSAVWVSAQMNTKHREWRVCSPQVVSGEPQHIVFTIPIFEPLPSQYYIRAVSDRWLGAEAVCIINFQDLILPERHPPHTGTHSDTQCPHRPSWCYSELCEEGGPVLTALLVEAVFTDFVHIFIDWFLHLHPRICLQHFGVVRVEALTFRLLDSTSWATLVMSDTA